MERHLGKEWQQEIIQESGEIWKKVSPGMVVDGLELPVVDLGEYGQHVERPGVPHLEVVGFRVELPSSSVVRRGVHLDVQVLGKGHTQEIGQSVSFKIAQKFCAIF